MKSYMKFFFSVLVLLTMLCPPIFSYAAEESGSIEIDFGEHKDYFEGAAFDLYYLADIQENADKSESYVNTAAFSGLAVDYNKISTAEGIREILDDAEVYIKNNDVAPAASETVGSNHTCIFSGLQPGVYVGIQTKIPSSGYEMTSFMVTLPYDGSMNVTTHGKSEDPKVPVSDTPTKAPSSSVGSSIPNTGMTFWLVPYLAAAGLAVFILGWYLRFAKKKHA